MNVERKNLRSVCMCAVVSQIIFSSKKIFSCGRLFITLYCIMTRQSIYEIEIHAYDTVPNYCRKYFMNKAKIPNFEI